MGSLFKDIVIVVMVILILSGILSRKKGLEIPNGILKSTIHSVKTANGK